MLTKKYQYIKKIVYLAVALLLIIATLSTLFTPLVKAHAETNDQSEIGDLVSYTQQNNEYEYSINEKI